MIERLIELLEKSKFGERAGVCISDNSLYQHFVDALTKEIWK